MSLDPELKQRLKTTLSVLTDRIKGESFSTLTDSEYNHDKFVAGIKYFGHKVDVLAMAVKEQCVDPSIVDRVLDAATDLLRIYSSTFTTGAFYINEIKAFHIEIFSRVSDFVDLIDDESESLPSLGRVWDGVDKELSPNNAMSCLKVIQCQRDLVQDALDEVESEPTELSTTIQGLIKTSAALLKKIHLNIRTAANISNQEIDAVTEAILRISPRVDDLVVSCSEAEDDDVNELLEPTRVLSETLIDILERVLVSKSCIHDLDTWSSFLVRAVHHNNTKIQEKISQVDFERKLKL